MALIFPLYQPGHSETCIDLTLEQCWVNLFTPSPAPGRTEWLCEDSRDTSSTVEGDYSELRAFSPALVLPGLGLERKLRECLQQIERSWISMICEIRG
ncbi:hypothetical protein CEXT_514481 [Caerostris extrusa]|uniref:Uncharacterized protein n=1 Tax=Caerostris extrusa TaxID=172846 RepID=A0AAV4T556_CAEEX|nr:hypothetical protein CEXT_514481 [Caerostris extrusa]